MNKDVPGNAMLSQLAYQQALIRQMQHMIRFEHTTEQLFEEDVELRGLSIRLPTEAGQDYLVTVRAYEKGKKVVAFNSGVTLAEVMSGTLARLQNRSLRWKVDDYGN